MVMHESVLNYVFKAKNAIIQNEGLLETASFLFFNLNFEKSFRGCLPVRS